MNGLSPEENPHIPNSPARALFLMVCAQFCFSVMTLLIKQAHKIETFHAQSLNQVRVHFGTWESVFFRCFPMMLMSVFLHQHRSKKGVLHPPITLHNVRWLLVRGIVGAASMACFFHGALNIPLGLASFFVNSSVFLIGLLGHAFLKERLTLQRTMFAVSGLAGVGLILGAGLDSTNAAANSSSLDYLISFISGILAAFAYFSVRKMPSIPGNTIIFSLSASGVALATGSFLIFEPLSLPKSGIALTLLLFSSVPAIVAQFLMTRAFKTGEAGFVALGQYSGPVFATLFGYSVFSEVLTPLQWLGALIALLFGVLLPLMETNIASKRPAQLTIATLRIVKERIRLP